MIIKHMETVVSEALKFDENGLILGVEKSENNRAVMQSIEQHGACSIGIFMQRNGFITNTDFIPNRKESTPILIGKNSVRFTAVVVKPKNDPEIFPLLQNIDNIVAELHASDSIRSRSIAVKLYEVSSKLRLLLDQVG